MRKNHSKELSKSTCSTVHSSPPHSPKVTRHARSGKPLLVVPQILESSDDLQNTKYINARQRFSLK
ncbi:MAG: hypothetical protein K8S54_03765, partial [Spirochaetia bacterium]|nr:hypothetical protein [Spirochaetia bacterium]